MLLPRLTPHPADPDPPGGAPWVNPDERADLPDRVTVLVAALAGDAGGGRLADLSWDGRLDALDIPVSSQGLIFSRTSLQTNLITPWTPRAVYFNDDMSPELVGQFDHRVPQRRFGTVAKTIEE